MNVSRSRPRRGTGESLSRGGTPVNDVPGTQGNGVIPARRRFLRFADGQGLPLATSVRTTEGRRSDRTGGGRPRGLGECPSERIRGGTLSLLERPCPTPKY